MSLFVADWWEKTGLITHNGNKWGRDVEKTSKFCWPTNILVVNNSLGKEDTKEIVKFGNYLIFDFVLESYEIII